ncbi:MAG: signal peptide peptidase SppA [Dehalococcoidia bacterium]
MIERLLNINPERIAVTELFGTIGAPARTTEYVRMFKALEENKRIRAVVIDIDSPGGSAGPSEYIFRSVARLAKQKPVIAFVRGMGASGAYMVACGATKVVAIPTALVGSIGVISMRPMLYELLEKIGVRVEIVKAGRLKDMFSFFREPTAEERQKEQALLDSFYERFVDLVSEARGMPGERVRELATGELFTAEQAKGNGLIDEIGDLETAIDQAQSLAEMGERRVTYVRPHRGLRDRLLGNSAMALVDRAAWALEGGLRRGISYRA